MADLSGYRVGVVEANAAQRILARRSDVNLTAYPDISQALFSLLAGHVDCVAYPEPIVWKLAREANIEARLKVIGHPLKVVKLAYAVGKGNTALFRRLNTAVKEFVVSPDYKQTYSTWFGKPKPPWIRIAAGLALVAVALMGGMAAWRHISVVGPNRELRLLVSRQRQAEASITREKERAEQFLDIAEAIIVWLDRKGNVELLNRQGYQVLGYEEGTLLGKNWFDLMVSDEQRAPVRALFDSHIREGVPPCQQSCRVN